MNNLPNILANVFGLHIGCKIKCRDKQGVLDLVRVDTGVPLIHYLPDNEKIRAMEKIENCKLLLTNISSITEDDKSEFEEYANLRDVVGLSVSDGIVYVHCNGGEEIFAFAVKPLHVVWLASKGYDCGIVPDEYKEVIE